MQSMLKISIFAFAANLLFGKPCNTGCCNINNEQSGMMTKKLKQILLTFFLKISNKLCEVLLFSGNHLFHFVESFVEKAFFVCFIEKCFFCGFIEKRVFCGFVEKHLF